MKCHGQTSSTVAATRIDMRNSMDFFCMLKTCALIKRLSPGESVHILANDRIFLADLQRVHPDCVFETVSCVMGFEENPDYLVRVSKAVSTTSNQRQGGPDVCHDRHLSLLSGRNAHQPDR